MFLCLVTGQKNWIGSRAVEGGGLWAKVGGGRWRAVGVRWRAVEGVCIPLRRAEVA